MVLGLLPFACFNASSGSLTTNTGFQGLHVANGGEDRSFHFMEGSVVGTNPDVGPSPLIPPPRRGAASNRTGAVKRTGDGREKRGWTAPRTTHPLSGVGLSLS